jgi:hypothetical protein
MVSWGRHPSSVDLREVVAALDGAHLAYRWFLSDIEANRIGVEASLPVELQLDAAGDTADCWLSGARLDVIANHYDFQLIWRVLSAFHPEAVPERTNPEPRPIAEGHSPTGMIQHPDAQIEIIAFDSTFTAISARDTEVEAAFGRYFSQGDASETT